MEVLLPKFALGLLVKARILAFPGPVAETRRALDWRCEMGIGDVMTVVWSILGCFLTIWAAVVAAGLLFPGPSERARKAIEEPKRAFFHGLALVATLGLLSLVMIVNPLPLFKTVGIVVLCVLLSFGILGTSGVSLAVGRRIQDLDPGMAAYPASVRAAAFVVGGTLMPLLGWFVFGPMLFITSLGAGWKAVVRPARRTSLSEVA